MPGVAPHAGGMPPPCLDKVSWHRHQLADGACYGAEAQLRGQAIGHILGNTIAAWRCQMDGNRLPM